VAIAYQQGRIGTFSELLASQPAGPDNTVGPTAGYAPEDTVPEFSPFALGMRAYPDTVQIITARALCVRCFEGMGIDADHGRVITRDRCTRSWSHPLTCRAAEAILPSLMPVTTKFVKTVAFFASFIIIGHC
jgi:hypothetical protein